MCGPRTCRSFYKSLSLFLLIHLPLTKEQIDEIIKAGKTGLKILREETKNTPFLAAGTIAIHGYNVPYESGQRYVEAFADMWHKGEKEKVKDPEFVREFCNREEAGPTIGFVKQRCELIPEVAECFEEFCGDDGQKCVTDPRARNQFLKCAKEIEGVGRKLIDLAAEYLGDDNAVAVDRHVARWAVKTGVYKPKTPAEEERIWEVGRISPLVYNKIAEAIRKVAEQVGVKPAEFQVGVWHITKCEPRGKWRPTKIEYVRGKAVACKLPEKPLEEYLT